MWVLLGVAWGQRGGERVGYEEEKMKSLSLKNRALSHWRADASLCLAPDTGFGRPQGLKGTIPETQELWTHPGI